MKRTLLNRILFSVVILFALTFFVFLLSNMIRGNQLDVLLAGEDGGMSEETYNAVRFILVKHKAELYGIIIWLNIKQILR